MNSVRQIFICALFPKKHRYHPTSTKTHTHKNPRRTRWSSLVFLASDFGSTSVLPQKHHRRRPQKHQKHTQPIHLRSTTPSSAILSLASDFGCCQILFRLQVLSLKHVETQCEDSDQRREMEARDHLNKYKVGSVPASFYIPDFISDSDQKLLLNHIYTAPVSKWKTLKNRRLQNWGGIVHEKGLLPQDLPSWLTKITEKISNESSLFPSAINHVLINEYLPNQGIMPHQDGPAYFPVVAILSLGSPVVMDFTPHSSLVGSTSNIEDRGSIEGPNHGNSQNHHPFSIALMPGSLLIFKDTAYSDYLHGIKDCEIQQYDAAVNATEVLQHQSVNETCDDDSKAIHRSTTRVSLTCRVVSKVHRNLFRF